MATLNDLEFQIVQGNYVLYIQLKLETDVSYKISYVYAIYSIITPVSYTHLTLPTKA